MIVLSLTIWLVNCLSLLVGGDSKRKVLPMWLKEELKKMEKKNAKAMEKEAQEKMMKGEGSKRPTWRDEMDSGGEGAEEERERAKEERERERNKKTSKTSRFYRNSNSASPDSVSIVKRKDL